jgi:hypothetical protein
MSGAPTLRYVRGTVEPGRAQEHYASGMIGRSRGV